VIDPVDLVSITIVVVVVVVVVVVTVVAAERITQNRPNVALALSRGQLT
jgi:hypothetical protein